MNTIALSSPPTKSPGMTQNSSYIGDELELFEKAINWKRYYASIVSPYLRGSVLEVGAGIGGTTRTLCDGTQQEWICLEPDSTLEQKIKMLVDAKELPTCCSSLCGILADLPQEKKFDSIIYMDVIEHIEDDYKELTLAASYLHSGGHLAILVPAHQFLFSPFDQSIGHYRRYSRKSLEAIIPSSLSIKQSLYLDSVGVMASFANKLLLKQSYPKESQILFWDRNMVKLSKFIDKIFGYHLGKSVLLIAQKK